MNTKVINQANITNILVIVAFLCVCFSIPVMIFAAMFSMPAIGIAASVVFGLSFCGLMAVIN